ncbi:MAG: dinitrogenase iron-molybdenum cofactor biosynthesis protein [Oscillospiraceae bacterium]|jgi:predicted Fe-Mo cluster-binding NifX family protein|nr:dinitrogenase iron-molybdenum cofactor biosynthesis protein [Oscillospiraceae bacterium]MDD3260834.1 NifB/NifX family molybdenum-iron cluster-binding protein [Oscillospiraceae bacterium]
MKIAVPYDENGMVFQHFGHTQTFKIYTTNEKDIYSSALLETNGSGHGALALLLKQNNVDVLICGGIGGGAKTALAKVNIVVYPGVNGSADQSVQALLNGTLLYNANAQCQHHSGQTCGEHKCL